MREAEPSATANPEIEPGERAGGISIEHGDAKRNEWLITLPGTMQEIAPDEETRPVTVSICLPEQLDTQERLRVLLFAHGQGGWPESLQSLLEELRAEAGVITIAPTTSRRPDDGYFGLMMRGGFNLDHVQQLHVQQLDENFHDKTLNDEQADFVAGFNAALAHIVEPLRAGRSVEINMMGTSMGGVVAACLSKDYSPHLLIVHGSPTMLSGDQRVVAGVGPQPPTAEEIVGAIHADEVLAIRGANDTAVGAEETQRYSAHHARGRYVEIPNMGHNAFLVPENQQFFAEILAYFTDQ